ncbi:MAG: adenylate cyclase [Pseudomonadota bacterium]|nr:adenylate cyclase [Pseudomonadota bacterium]
MHDVIPVPEYSRKRNRLSIAIKLAIAIGLLIITGMGLLGFVILQQQKNVLSQQIDNMGNTLARQLANSASDLVMADDALGLQTLANSLPDNNVLGVLVVSEKGETLAGSGIQPDTAIIETQREKTLLNSLQQVHAFEWQNGSHVLRSFISPIEFNNLVAGHVVLTFSSTAMQQSLRASGLMIIQITVLSALLAIVVAFIMSRHLSRPILHLVTASQEIDQGNYAYRLREYRNDEIGDLAQAFNQMAEGLLRKTQVENAFSRYVSSNVARKIMEQPDRIELGGRHVQASVVFADVVGFTALAENMSPQDVIELLNEYFSYIARIASMYRGHIDKFIGDCAMIVFGVTDEDADHSFHALACAVMIHKLVMRLNEFRIRRGLLPVHFKIGVNSGNMVAGNLGSAERMDYTVIGDTVNLASRLSAVAGSGQIVILDELYQQPGIKQRVLAQAFRTIQVRGKQKPVTTWLVYDVNGEDFQIMQDRIDTILLGKFTP